MADTPPFSPLVPGFEFLQNLVKNAGSAMPAVGQWIAPTLNPEELEKRIGELRTVQFWLEQNARMLATTIQALEVQRMTLSTLKTMNVQMGDLRDSLQARPSPAPATPPSPAAEPAAEPKAKAEAPPPAVDPVQWWGALTKQFSQLAASALADHPAATPPAGGTPAAAKAPAKKAPRTTSAAAPRKRAAPKR